MGSSASAEEPALFRFGAFTVSPHLFLPRAKVNSSPAEVKLREVIRMSHAIPSVQAVNAQSETQHAAQAPKSPQATTQTAAPQDKVTISESAKQVLAGNAKPVAGEK